MATNFSCCDLYFNCLDCPIITGPDCIAPNNLLPGQMWYNPCTCTYYFSCSGGFDEEDNCETYTPVNHKAGAGISYSGNCEEGSYISVKILPNGGLAFEGDGSIRVDCEQLMENCSLWHAGNCEEMVTHCQLFTKNNLVPADGHFYLECEDDEVGNEICTFYIDTIIQARNAGEVASAGVCLRATPTSFAGGTYALWRSRDNTFVAGGGTIDSTNTGQYVTETFSNPWADAAYLEVDLICQDNANGTGSDTIGFIHSITEELAVTPPVTGAMNTVVFPNWAYNQVNTGLKYYDPMAPDTEFPPSPTFSPQTVAAKFSRLLLPGESITLYYQWWAVFPASTSGKSINVHGGTATASKLIRHAAHF